jgi:hypothetical protein
MRVVRLSLEIQTFRKGHSLILRQTQQPHVAMLTDGLNFILANNWNMISIKKKQQPKQEHGKKIINRKHKLNTTQILNSR